MMPITTDVNGLMCPFCDYDAGKANSKFCVDCGKPLIKVLCICFEPLHSADMFCPGCGMAVSDAIEGARKAARANPAIMGISA